jgi:hypothetical protein
MFLEKLPMFRFVRVKLIRSVALIKGAFTAPKVKDQGTPVNPWEADLARLANERKNEVVSITTAKEHDEITQLVNDLAKAVKKDESAIHPPEPKLRRAGDGTVTDLKSWWGDSLATWDPDTDGKNVTSADTRNKARQVKWFDKGPGFDK